MSDLKLACKTCGQPILVNTRDIGRTIQCPSCQSSVTIEAPEQVETATKAPSPQPAAPPAPATLPPELTPPSVQVAVLTPEIKFDVLRSARRLIADASRWMPGLSEDGKYRYAEGPDGGQLAPAELGNREASRHSLMGAVLVELQKRNVTAIARGRLEFLDQEIPGAIRQVIGGDADQPAESLPDPSGADPRLMAIRHDQCLDTLDRLARNYKEMAASQSDSKGNWEVQGATFSELMARAARDELITNTELLRAVYRELSKLERRVEVLEQASADPR